MFLLKLVCSCCKGPFYPFLVAETNKKVFFDELNETLNKAVNKYDNIFLAGDLNIDTGDKSKDTNNYLCDFMNTLICYRYYP